VGATTKSTFGRKPSRGSYRKGHCHKPWFDADCRIVKHELKLWLKVNLDSQAANQQETKLINLLKKKRVIWETTKAQHMCTHTKVDALLF
jgi:hypothetical protein